GEPPSLEIAALAPGGPGGSAARVASEPVRPRGRTRIAPRIGEARPRRASIRQGNAKARKLSPREVLVVEAPRPRSGWRPRSTLRRVVGLAWLGYRACDVMSFEAGPHTAPVTVTRHDRNPTPRPVGVPATPARRP